MKGTPFPWYLLTDHEIHQKYDKIDTVSNLVKELTLHSKCDGIMNGRIQRYSSQRFLPSKNDRTIIRTGKTCKKIPCYMRDSASRWLIVENAKIFCSYVKYF